MELFVVKDWTETLSREEILRHQNDGIHLENEYIVALSIEDVKNGIRAPHRLRCNPLEVMGVGPVEREIAEKRILSDQEESNEDK